MKAFFSYSHQDSELVTAVAKNVGRPFVNIDKIVFTAGADLVDAMESAVSGSEIFVLFASKASLESV